MYVRRSSDKGDFDAARGFAAGLRMVITNFKSDFVELYSGSCLLAEFAQNLKESICSCNST